MKLFKAFKRRKSIRSSNKQFDTPEILFVMKSQYNKYERSLREKFLNELEKVSQTTNMQFKNVRIQSRIGEYDNLSFELISGVLFQLNYKLGGKEISVRNLLVKVTEDTVDIEMSFMDSFRLKSFVGKTFRTSFGKWKIYQGESISLTASFNKKQYRIFIVEQSSHSQKGRNHYGQY